MNLVNTGLGGMPELNLGLAPLFPLALGAALLVPSWRSAVWRLTPFALLPALMAALLTPPGVQLHLSWLLLEARLGLDSTGQAFLLFSSLLWLFAGVYARAYMSKDKRRTGFLAFYLMAMAGNIGIVLAQDMVSFYLFFSLMSFSSYGLVVHHRTPEALRAGRVYIALVVLGEVLLYTALVIMVSGGGSLNLEDVSRVRPQGGVLFLLLLGFGIKAGALPLHVWLPLAHPEAPTPASAVLSGVMIKAGLLGWLRFLPLGVGEPSVWGSLCVGAGVLAVFYGVLVGLPQSNPKTVLAYSSISQMGYMTVGVGLGLMLPDVWPAARSAVLFYAVHHAFAKGTLFLGVGVMEALSLKRRPRDLATAGLMLPALAMAGAPLTSGAAAKNALKSIVVAAPFPWSDWLVALLMMAAFGTALLMGRFLQCVRREQGAHAKVEVRGLWGPWVVLLLFVAGFGYVEPPLSLAVEARFSLSGFWMDFLPVGLGALVCWAASIAVKRGRMSIAIRIPPGDLMAVAGCFGGWLHRGVRLFIRVKAVRGSAFVSGSLGSLAQRVRLVLEEVSPEAHLARWDIWGFLFMLFSAAIFLSLALNH